MPATCPSGSPENCTYRTMTLSDQQKRVICGSCHVQYTGKDPVDTGKAPSRPSKGKETQRGGESPKAAPGPNGEAKKPKYRNKKVTVNGETFDSRKEADRYIALRAMEQAGEIAELARQVSFPLEINGQKICKYIADFVYYRRPHGPEKGWQCVIEDVKSEHTKKLPVYRLKKKLMLAIKDVVIQEV